MKFKPPHWEIVLFVIINILCVATLGFIMLMTDYIPSLSQLLKVKYRNQN